DALLRAEAISKSFGPVAALNDVTMDIIAGEITGLVGDNGAGKSTLVKIISGVLRPDVGTITFDGARVDFASPAEARSRGIETVYQDLALAGNMTVWANLYLGREIVHGPRFMQVLDKRAMVARTGEMLRQFIANVPPMDEPTAALGVAETRAVEDVIRGLKARGLTILVISHNLDQILRITDRIVV